MAKTDDNLEDLTVDELRERAKDEGVSGTSGMKKSELVDAIRGESGGGADSDGGETTGAGEPGDAGPDGGRMRTGPETSKSLKYSQEVTSPDDDPERPGRSLVTTSHEVIRQWAEERGGVPATVESTGPKGQLGVLRVIFPDRSDAGDSLTEVGWDEWFATFDERSLNFIYQEERSDGTQSSFHRLENPNREDG